jgi:uncharacterized membrane protein YeaQ/YmgE (transglycosylase-associated protein family)
MKLETFLIMLAVGALAGWISGLITKRKGFGPIGNVIVGIAGAAIAQFVFGLVGIVATGFRGHLVFAVAGALVFVYLLGFIKR